VSSVSSGDKEKIYILILLSGFLMGKTIRGMTIDSDVYERFQNLFPHEASSFCEDCMRKRIQTSETDVSGISQEMLALEESKLQKALDSLNSKMKGVKEQKEKIAQSIQDVEMKKLQEKKERIDNMGKCEACGCQISDLGNKIMIGQQQFCKECFFNEHPTFMKAQKEARSKDKEVK